MNSSKSFSEKEATQTNVENPKLGRHRKPFENACFTFPTIFSSFKKENINPPGIAQSPSFEFF